MVEISFRTQQFKKKPSKKTSLKKLVRNQDYIPNTGFVHKKRWGFKKLIYLFYESKINL